MFLLRGVMPFLCRGRFVNITMKIAVDVVPDMMMISVMMIVMLLMMMVLMMLLDGPWRGY